MNMGDFKCALECLSKAIKLNPNDAVINRNKGEVLNNLDKYMEAVVCFDKAIELNPNDKFTYECKELCLKKFAKGLAEHDELIESTQNKAIAFNKKGNYIPSKSDFKR